MKRHLPRISALVLYGLLVGAVHAQVVDRIPSAMYGSSDSQISDDGELVVFFSYYDGLIPGDTNSDPDIFLHDRTTGVVERINLDSNGLEVPLGSREPDMTPDARFVTFTTQWWMVPDDTNLEDDVYVVDREFDSISRVSLGDIGQQGNGASYFSAVSADGRFVAFESTSTNLISGMPTQGRNVFVRDMQAGTTELISRTHDTGASAAESRLPRISSDGRFIVFNSTSPDIVSDDTNGLGDVFVHDRMTATTELVSIDTNGVQGDGASGNGRISDDGRYVAFLSASQNFLGIEPVSPFFKRNAFLYDRQTSTLTVVTSNTEAPGPVCSVEGIEISGDGSFVVFETLADDLVEDDEMFVKDVFKFSLGTGTYTRLSVGMSGQESEALINGVSLSRNGEYLSFDSLDSGILPGDTNDLPDIYIAKNDRLLVTGMESVIAPRCNARPVPLAR